MGRRESRIDMWFPPQIDGVNGTLIANQYVREDPSVTNSPMRTLITLDNGGFWELVSSLLPPLLSPLPPLSSLPLLTSSPLPFSLPPSPPSTLLLLSLLPTLPPLTSHPTFPPALVFTYPKRHWSLVSRWPPLWPSIPHTQ